MAVLTLFTFALKAQQYHIGDEYVDLGLSVKWATCNEGATAPEGYGNYYAWGETKSKSSHNWDNYKYRSVPSTLPLSADAARVNWGGSWRMPTLEEFKELMDNCTWTWTTRRGVNGYKVTSKMNGNSIFLPVAGSRFGSNLECEVSYGSYWSSSLNMDNSRNAYDLLFDSIGVACWYDNIRTQGQSVRAVCE